MSTMNAESVGRTMGATAGETVIRPKPVSRAELLAVELPKVEPLRVDLGTYQKNHDWLGLVRRGLWSCVQIAFWPKRPRSLSGVRVALLRLFGAKVGRNVLICGGVHVTVPWLLELDEYAVLGDDVKVYNLAAVRIGAHAVVSQGVHLCTATHDYTQTDFPLYSKPIDVGAQCWLAAGVFVGPGLTIGEGSVVGAQSVVTRDVPAWMVTAGNPCRVIKPRELREK
jgi:putative colanic acid biosynthesis acetyltransferase WcaF